ncbi:methyltransferase domain-containing protein [Halomonas sp. 328]|uniref:methyltransferase domain-containing protein n=1 Tax=Halomonas sp. 328 TaxID=2776704 RepID=UPI0018A71C7D|nr:methyltransferase domain-containing protein [Halomonas sp. 328]MBF8221731.1 methyltransferase domain-containing protein [Halomonas sp. 328]
MTAPLPTQADERGAEPPDWRRRVARAFGRAAPHYCRRAAAQAALGEHLWRHLPAHAETILDLGCGPGHWSARLAAHYPMARVIGLDLAPAMLTEARRRHGEAIAWVPGDAAALPLANGSLDLLFSNLAIQWCPDVTTVLAEARRVLRPGGRALINTLGPGTLAEVAMAWSRPGRPAALLDFIDAEGLEAAARRAGFARVRLESARERFFYPDLAAVMASIKGVGAQVAPDKDAPRLGRADLARARERFEGLREPAGLPVSYQRLTLILDR